MYALVLTILVAGLSPKDASAFSYHNDSIQNCVPNSEFFYDDNNCKCNSKGTEIICDRSEYSSVTPIFHVQQLQNLTVECVPTRVFMFMCRKCLCDESGKYATCVQADCSDSDQAFDKPERCIPGSVFNAGCNGCICGADGKAACTKLGCTAGERKNPECVPNSNYKYKCNHCSCTSNGRQSCFKMGCGDFEFWPNHVLNVTMSCKAKNIFDYNCHECVCGDDGSYAICNGKPCSNYDKQKDTKEKCNPGIIFGEDCNVCVCGDNEKGICTTFSCDTKYRLKHHE